MTRKVLQIFFFTLVFFAFPIGFVSAYYNPGSPSGFVNDFSGTLTVEQKRSLENKLSQFEKGFGDEISVVLISSLKEDTVENFAEELFKEWGIGKKGKDNGVLILVAMQEKKMRIEVGYGLEEKVTDAEAGRVINSIMKPAFQNKNYFQGIDQSVDALVSVIGGIAPPSLESEPETISTSVSTEKSSLNWVVFVFFAFLYLLGLLLGKSRSYWAGGIIGALIGVSVGYFLKSFSLGVWLVGILGILGLIFDYIVSRVTKSGNGGGGWFGGGSSSSGGGFGGFGGGRSGGGGSSGSW